MLKLMMSYDPIDFQEFRTQNCAALDGVGVAHVLDYEGRWPFPDRSVEYIECVDVMQYVKDRVNFFNEAHRTLTLDGVLKVKVPYGHTVYATEDPRVVYRDTFFDLANPSRISELGLNGEFKVESFDLLFVDGRQYAVAVLRKVS